MSWVHPLLIVGALRRVPATRISPAARMATEDETIEIVIVDDHRMVREGLTAMLRETKVRVVAEAETIEEALDAIEREQPDAVLLDVRLQGQSGLTACRLILEKHPEVSVIFLTVYEDEQYVFEALRAGAKGYMLKRASAEDIVNVLEQVAAGETIVDASLAGKIAVRASHGSPGRVWPGAEMGITQRESEVLGAIVDGLNNRAIAEQLVISEDTVKTHVRSIFRKLGVTDRSQAVSVALREGVFK